MTNQTKMKMCPEKKSYEPVSVETNELCFRPGPTQTGLYKHRRWLEAGYFGFRKKRKCTIRVAKTKALISFAVTANCEADLRLFFAYANCWFSHAKAHIILVSTKD